MCLHVLYMYLSVPGMIPNFDGSKKKYRWTDPQFWMIKELQPWPYEISILSSDQHRHRCGTSRICGPCSLETIGFALFFVCLLAYIRVCLKI